MSLEQVIKRQKEIKGTLDNIVKAMYQQGSRGTVALNVHNNSETLVQNLSGQRFKAFLENEKVLLEEELAVIDNALRNANIFVQGFMKGEEPPVASEPQAKHAHARPTPSEDW